MSLCRYCADAQFIRAHLPLTEAIIASDLPRIPCLAKPSRCLASPDPIGVASLLLQGSDLYIGSREASRVESIVHSGNLEVFKVWPDP